MASVFEGLELGPPIEVFALNKSYNEDKSPVKVNLGVGGMNFYAIFTICYDFLLLEGLKFQTQLNKTIFRHITRYAERKNSNRIDVAFI